jgi:hypothetical protein
MNVTQTWYNNMMTALEKSKDNYTQSDAYKIEALQNNIKQYSKMEADGNITMSLADSNIKKIVSYMSSALTSGIVSPIYSSELMEKY